MVFSNDIKNFITVIKEKIKYWSMMTILSIVIVIILSLLKYEPIALLLTFVVGNYGIGYIMSRNTIIRGIKYQKLYGDDFNQEYFDLYNEYKRMEATLLYNVQLTVISLTQMAAEKLGIINWQEYIALDLIACFIGMIALAFYFAYNPKEKNINALFFERKKNWFGPYTKKEEELLRIITSTEM